MPAPAIAPTPPAALTPGQLAVVALLAEGKAPHEVAAILDKAIGTTNLHILLARRRLGCATVDDLVAEARRRGLIG